MMTLFEDLKLALRQICGAIGLERTGAAVIPLVMLGLALNFAALNATGLIRHSGKKAQRHSEFRKAASTEFKAARIVMRSAVKKIKGQPKWCSARQWVQNKQKKINTYRVEVGFERTGPAPIENCDVKFMGSATQKRMIAVVQC